MSDVHFRKIALVGIGLIGSSIARVAKREGLAETIAISTRSAETLGRARELGLGHSYHISAAEAVEDADLVIVAVPVGASGAVAQAISGALKAGAIVTDVGSTKASVIAQMAPHIPAGVHFVPGHPIAGTEYSGPDAGFAELFRNRWCILTPLPRHRSGGADRGADADSGRPAARRSTAWIRSTTTWCSPSSRTCRTSSPTTSSARRTTWRR